MTVELTPLGVQCNLSCTYCADPDTPVLLRSGGSKKLSEITVGDALWSFEENRRELGAHRALLEGTVTHVWTTRRPTLRVIHEHGELLLGEEHHILDRRNRWIHAHELVPGRRLRYLPTPTESPEESADYRLGYIAGIWEGDGTIGEYDRTGLIGGKTPYGTKQNPCRLAMLDEEALDRTQAYAAGVGAPLRRIVCNAGAGYKMPALFSGAQAVFTRMQEILQPREDNKEWLRGWIAGMFDAEGTQFRHGPPTICQKHDERRHRVTRALRRFGFEVTESAYNVRVLGGFQEALRFSALFQPALLRKTDLTGQAPRYNTSAVLAVEKVGMRDLADISVAGAPTYFAAGIPSHNCYQLPMRDAGNVGNRVPYDFDKMFAALEREGSAFSVFGGEPLLVPLPDLERIFAWGFERYKYNGIQTNGVLITPAHIEVFKKYNVHVGFSLDGPDEMNDSRWAGTLERTRAQSVKSHDNLAQCLAAGVGTSVIITMYRGNATGDRLPRLTQWIQHLDRIGVRGVRIHMLEIDHPLVREQMQLTEEENIIALRAMATIEKTLKTVRLDILTDMRKLLRADDDSVTCTWNPCDPYTTSAVQGVDGQGNQSNCGRTNKDGIGRLKAERGGHERQLALYHTPYENGGCKGCRFFLMCKGQCPGTAIDGDWRNRASDCKVWMTLFQDLETEMMLAGERPLSLRPELADLEKAMLGLWERGQSMSLRQALALMAEGKMVALPPGAGSSVHGDAHGDHTDANAGVAPVLHADAPHGDSPHGDIHGDHTDEGAAETTGEE